MNQRKLPFIFNGLAIQAIAFCFLWFLYSMPVKAEQYWGMPGRKLENYFSQGFSKNDFAKTTKSSKLKKIRAFYKKDLGYERIVFDLATDLLPKSMVYLSENEKHVAIRFEGTTLSSDYKKHQPTQMFSLYESYRVDQSALMMKLSFKRPKEIDVFYLEKPARLVIDARVKGLRTSKKRNNKNQKNTDTKKK